MTLTIRAASALDRPFLERMLAVAADWQPGRDVRPVDEVLAVPELARYVAGWPRNGDVGFVADGSEPVGAAWWRFFTVDAPGYGFVEEAIPEVSIGIAEAHRGRGIGTRLMQRLIEEAIQSNVPALSLSVDNDNPAMNLYRRLGFADLRQKGTSLTMLLAVNEMPRPH